MATPLITSSAGITAAQNATTAPVATLVADTQRLVDLDLTASALADAVSATAAVKSANGVIVGLLRDAQALPAQISALATALAALYTTPVPTTLTLAALSGTPGRSAGTVDFTPADVSLPHEVRLRQQGSTAAWSAYPLSVGVSHYDFTGGVLDAAYDVEVYAIKAGVYSSPALSGTLQLGSGAAAPPPPPAQTLDHLKLTISSASVVETGTPPTVTPHAWADAAGTVPYTGALTDAYSSSAANVAAIGASDAVIVLHGPGTATFTLTAGGKSASVNLTVTAAPAPAPTAPNAPTAGNATAQTSGSLTFPVTLAATGSAPTKLRPYILSNGSYVAGTDVTVAAAQGAVQSVTLSGLPATTTQSVKFTEVNAGGESGYSNVATGTTSAAVAQPAGSPTLASISSPTISRTEAKDFTLGGSGYDDNCTVIPGPGLKTVTPQGPFDSPANMWTFPRTFSDPAVWGKNGVTLGTPRRGPTGIANGATKLVQDTSTSDHTMYRQLTGIPAGGQSQAVAKVWEGVHAGENNVVMVKAAGVRGWVNLTTGEIQVEDSFANMSVELIPIGGGWFNIPVSCSTQQQNNMYFDIGPCSAMGAKNYVGDGVSGIYLSGAQVEVAARASFSMFTQGDGSEAQFPTVNSTGQMVVRLLADANAPAGDVLIHVHNSSVNGDSEALPVSVVTTAPTMVATTGQYIAGSRGAAPLSWIDPRTSIGTRGKTPVLLTNGDASFRKAFRKDFPGVSGSFPGPSTGYGQRSVAIIDDGGNPYLGTLVDNPTTSGTQAASFTGKVIEYRMAAANNTSPTAAAEWHKGLPSNFGVRQIGILRVIARSHNWQVISDAPLNTWAGAWSLGPLTGPAVIASAFTLGAAVTANAGASQQIAVSGLTFNPNIGNANLIIDVGGANEETISGDPNSGTSLNTARLQAVFTKSHAAGVRCDVSYFAGQGNAIKEAPYCGINGTRCGWYTTNTKDNEYSAMPNAAGTNQGDGLDATVLGREGPDFDSGLLFPEMTYIEQFISNVDSVDTRFMGMGKYIGGGYSTPEAVYNAVAARTVTWTQVQPRTLGPARSITLLDVDSWQDAVEYINHARATDMDRWHAAVAMWDFDENPDPMGTLEYMAAQVPETPYGASVNGTPGATTKFNVTLGWRTGALRAKINGVFVQGQDYVIPKYVGEWIYGARAVANPTLTGLAAGTHPVEWFAVSGDGTQLSPAGAAVSVTVPGGGGGGGGTPPASFPAYDKTINFRASAAFVTDAANETYCVGDTASVTRNGTGPFYWDAGVITRDRDNTVDRRFAGMNGTDTSQAKIVFHWGGLVAGATYAVHLAGADQYGSANVTIDIMDGASVLASVFSGVDPGIAVDAYSTRLALADWPTQEVPRSVTITGTELDFRVGNPGLGSKSVLSSIRLVRTA